MKKTALTALAVLLVLVLLACNATPKLHVLNWGDYMDRDLVAAFEAEYGVRVVYREVDTNEEIADLLETGATLFDVVIPSDYMIDHLVGHGMLQPLDFGLLPHYAGLTVTPRLAELYGDPTFAGYVVPYAWGTMGILYNTDAAGLADYVETKDWAALFESASLYDVGMYDSPRDAVAAALLYHGFDVNSDDEEELDLAETALKTAGFTIWGADNLRDLVIAGTLDLALVYSGDYVSAYADALAADRALTIAYYLPDVTNVWMDAIGIPAASDNPALAHAFIDFMLRHENALRNYRYIGYAPPYAELYEAMIDDPGIDLAAFDPYPVGAVRVRYEYGSDARADVLADIIHRAKTGD